MDAMDIVAMAVNAVVVGAVGLALWWAFKGRFEALDKRMDRFEARFDAFQAEMRSELSALRSDLTQVALAMGVQPRAEPG